MLLGARGHSRLCFRRSIAECFWNTEVDLGSLCWSVACSLALCVRLYASSVCWDASSRCFASPGCRASSACPGAFIRPSNSFTSPSECFILSARPDASSAHLDASRVLQKLHPTCPVAWFTPAPPVRLVRALDETHKVQLDKLHMQAPIYFRGFQDPWTP